MMQDLFYYVGLVAVMVLVARFYNDFPGYGIVSKRGFVKVAD